MMTICMRLMASDGDMVQGTQLRICILVGIVHCSTINRSSISLHSHNEVRSYFISEAAMSISLPQQDDDTTFADSLIYDAIYNDRGVNRACMKPLHHIHYK